MSSEGRLEGAPPAGSDDPERVPPSWGPVRTLPDSLELRLLDSDRRVRLEPQGMRVWLALVESEGRMLSREQLHRRVWGHRPVTDDAIHRQLSKLRRKLDDLQPGLGSAIETVPRVGTRLRAAPASLAPALPETAPDADGTPAAPPRRRRRSRARLLAALILLPALALAAWLWSQRNAAAPAYAAAAQTLTTASGWETQPVWLGRDGRWLYRARSERGQPWQIRLRDAQGGEQRLGDDTHSYLRLAAAPDGQQLAVLAQVGADCKLELLDLQGRRIRALGSCEGIEEDSLTYSADGQALLLARRRDPQSPYRLLKLDLASGLESLLSSPPDDSFGDIQPSPSPDGRQLAFLRMPALGVADLHLLDLGDGRERRLTEENLKVHGAAWTADSRQLLLSSNRGGPFALWLLDVHDGRWQPFAGGQPGEFPALHPDGRLLFEHWTVDVNLWRQPLCGPEPATALSALNSAVWDWNPMLDREGRLVAWLSNRSGPPEIWMPGDDGLPRPLSRLGGPYLREAALSPDGQHIAAIVSGPHGFDLALFDIADGAVRWLVRGPGEERAPEWTADGRLLFVSARSGTPRLYRFDPARGDAEPTLDARLEQSVFAARETADGALWWIRPEGGGLWRLPPDSDAAQQRLPALEPLDGLNWSTGPAGLAYLWRDGQGGNFWRRESPAATAPDLALGRVPMPVRLTVSPDGCSLIVPRVDFSDAAILQLG